MYNNSISIFLSLCQKNKLFLKKIKILFESDLFLCYHFILIILRLFDKSDATYIFAKNKEKPS